MAKRKPFEARFNDNRINRLVNFDIGTIHGENWWERLEDLSFEQAREFLETLLTDPQSPGFYHDFTGLPGYTDPENQFNQWGEEETNWWGIIPRADRPEILEAVRDRLSEAKEIVIALRDPKRFKGMKTYKFKD